MRERGPGIQVESRTASRRSQFGSRPVVGWDGRRNECHSRTLPETRPPLEATPTRSARLVACQDLFARGTWLLEELATRVPTKLLDPPGAPIAEELDQFAIREPGRRSVALD